MKRSAIVLCVLAALSVGCVAAAHGMLMGTADKVEFRSAALFGDIAAADGLTLTARQACGRQLYWDSALPVAAPERAETAFAALPLAQPRQDDPSLHGLTLYTSIGTGSYDFGGGAEPSGLRAMLAGPGRAVPDSALTDLILDAVERTEAGSCHEETLRLRDYCEYLPLTLLFDLGERTTVYWKDKPYLPEQDESGLAARFRDDFRIPVPEDAAFTVRVTKNAKGQVMTLETDPAPFDGGIDARSLVTAGKIWFALAAYGEPAFDLSELRNGHGLYCLPFSTRPDGSGGQAADVDPDALRVVLPLAADETPVDLLDGGNGTLLLVLRTERGAELVVLDAETGRERQRVLLFDAAALGEEGFVFAPLGDGFYASCDSRVRWYGRGADGCYALLLDAPGWPSDERFDAYRYYTPSAAAWDGERLALAIASSSGYRWDYGNDAGSLLLAVFDASGPRYCGTLASGAMQTASVRFDQRVFWGESGTGHDESCGLALRFDTQ